MPRFFRRLAEGAFDDGAVLSDSQTSWKTCGADTASIVESRLAIPTVPTLLYETG